MFKSLFRDRYLIIFLLLAVLIKLFSLNEAWVEQCYSTEFYPFISKILRLLLGWIPFSIGDLFYLGAFIWLVFKTWKLLQLVRKRKMKEHFSWMLFRKYLKLSLLLYFVFSLNWGLNYYRQGIKTQLGLKLEPYSPADLFALTTALQTRLNSYAEQIDSIQRLQYNDNNFLFSKGKEAYQTARQQYPFLAYSVPSIKPSIFTSVGHWFGFTGYYNPFSAEAQLKTTIPVFLKPFVVTHEIAHQLGYAKENEASFVAYLTCKTSPDINCLYSVYFEMYRDAVFECRQTADTAFVRTLVKNIHPRVKWDNIDLRNYNLQNKNLVEPVMTGAYDKYLRLNNQPKGRATYNEVIAYLIAYMKKFGKGAI
jgi:hypothetical protein